MKNTTRDYRHIQFCEGHLKVNIPQLIALFNSAAIWAKNRKIEDLEIAIANSNPVITVWDLHTMIGFGRATSDCVYRGTIWDIVIHPNYQGGGLGRKLVQTILSHPRMCYVERVYLMTTYQQNFYKRIGFQHNQSTTMILYNQPIEAEIELTTINQASLLAT
ncbi:MAG: GNAT family N-acetyltransferase [Trichodesmium sp. St16_bin4-tuft]|nr:GNAT family N-acetyltransferase [Trichodesmium sp. MAG_R01]MDE5069033.1 GNAT family N-acetyltransferase [Trichodesmium sp. St4_bin8_1]MDE5072084.1 GNAT family N-acetyltransferase [Trichodesmium sp. St5_bin8]MDE5078235.1 GNAT family N-acetyltransferase [Trichodesmium sp. St2_bin6]MDE5090684.1 GNAT family N-acetyltransferase [Trichodesmium sp. St18_bin3_1_1]MDE5098112.1 GNAT family N-acetyltransferase [Trichodesmium sp. St16_bin4-tuft]MDE5101503.1 GNAT family N-acetyltransferase [Trichodesmi